MVYSQATVNEQETQDLLSRARENLKGNRVSAISFEPNIFMVYQSDRVVMMSGQLLQGPPMRWYPPGPNSSLWRLGERINDAPKGKSSNDIARLRFFLLETLNPRLIVLKAAYSRMRPNYVHLDTVDFPLAPEGSIVQTLERYATQPPTLQR